MKFALIDGKREEATPKASGACPGCGQPLIARCGNVLMWHWSHRGHRLCDPWWENETEWHRSWKNLFPPDWQEVVHTADNGERHIADVKTPDGRVFEFQHSNIKLEERQSREDFYKKLIWIVDGKRRLRDEIQFAKAWARGESFDPFSEKRRIHTPDGALLRDWSESPAHVFFDFGNEQPLWWLFPMSDSKRAYIKHIGRAEFARAMLETRKQEPSAFAQLVNNFHAFVARYEPHLTSHEARQLQEYPSSPSPLELARRQVAKRRFRF